MTSLLCSEPCIGKQPGRQQARGMQCHGVPAIGNIQQVTSALCSSFLLQALVLVLFSQSSEGGAGGRWKLSPSARSCGPAWRACISEFQSFRVHPLRGGSPVPPQIHPQVLQERMERGLTPPPPQMQLQLQQDGTEPTKTPPPQNIHPQVLQERIERGLTPPPPQIQSQSQASPQTPHMHSQVLQKDERPERGKTPSPPSIPSSIHIGVQGGGRSSLAGADGRRRSSGAVPSTSVACKQ